MLIKINKKLWPHILIWIAMFFHFIFAPEIYSSITTKNGKPVRTNGDIPPDSNRITLVVEGFEPYKKNGDNLFNLYGWALIVPDEIVSNDQFIREITLISDENLYFFSLIPVYRNPPLPDGLADIEIDLNTLGFSALISRDAIKPGKYRIGIVFRNVSTGLEYYMDKPSRYLVKTPNTITFQKSAQSYYISISETF